MQLQLKIDSNYQLSPQKKVEGKEEEEERAYSIRLDLKKWQYTVLSMWNGGKLL